MIVWKLTRCPKCDAKLFGGMRMYNFGRRWLCADCLVDVVHEADADELADLLSIQTCDVQDVIDEEDELRMPIGGGAW